MPARMLSRAVAFLLLCAAPLFTQHAVAEEPVNAPVPSATPAVAPAAPEPDEADELAAGTGKGKPAPASGSAGPRSAAKSAKTRRGGVHPCMTPDPGFGSYSPWSRAVSTGQMIAPKAGGIRKDGGFDLIIHFHGHEAVRKEFVKTSNGVVLVGIDLGIGSGAYQTGFASPQTFTKLVSSVEAEMTKRSGNPKAHVRKLGLSAWSAGYGAIEQILRQTAGKNVDAVILLDSLHAGYDNEQQKTLKTAQIEPFVAFAKRAASNKTFMFMSHSSIIPPGYASTTEVASYVVSKVGGKAKKAKRQDVLGLDMIRRYDKSGFHVRGYDGDDKPDHCAHLGLMAAIMKVHILPRWKTPQSKTTTPKQRATVKTPAKAGKSAAKDDKKAQPKDDKKAQPKGDKKAPSPAVKKVAAKSDKSKKPKKK